MENTNVLENDSKGNFLIETSPQCFNHCIQNIQSEELSQYEKICLSDCYAKMYYSHSNFLNKIN